MSDNSVAALAVVCIFGAPVAAFIVIKVLAHRERIEMIRRGIVPPSRNPVGPAAFPVGSPPAPPPAWSAGPSDPEADRSLRKGIMLTLIGLAILIGLSFIGYENGGPFNSPQIHPGRWLLGGLIPMFVGVARIIIALLSGARLGPPGPRPAAPPYPGAAPAAPPYPSAGPAAPPYPGAGPAQGQSAYEPEPRTHSGYEELKRPTPPPERR
jgi:hypothetical protein